MEINKRKKGSCYEEMAASFLQSKKYELLCKNYKKASGEIDLICKDPNHILVFVEVKYRSSSLKGTPEDTISYTKQKRLFRTAEWYLKENRLSFTTPCRFDAICILGEQITHIKNAFGGF